MLALGSSAFSQPNLDVVSVKTLWFAIDPNWHNAFQRALDDGRVIRVPAGTYDITGATLLPKSGTHIIGTRGKTSLTKSTGTVPSPSYSSPFMRIMDVFDVTIEGVTFDAPMPPTVREYAIIAGAASLGGCGRIKVRDCTFKNASVHVERFVAGFEFIGNQTLGGGVNGAIHGIAAGGYVDDIGGGTVNADGIVSGLWIERCYVEQVRTEAVDLNWNVENAFVLNNHFRNCDLQNAGDVVDCGGDAAGNGRCSFITIANNVITQTGATATAAIRIKGGTIAATITGNVLSSVSGLSGSAGIIVQHGSKRCSISGNATLGFQTGITLTAASNSNTINDNTIESPLLDGITVNGCTDNIIDGNRIVSPGSRGIYLLSAPDNVVSDNRVNGGAATCITVDAASPDCTVTGNVCVGATVDGIVVAGARSVVTNNIARGNGRHGLNLGATYLVATGNTGCNNGQISASSAGIIVQAGCTGLVLVGNSGFDDQGTKTQAYGLLFNGISDRIKANDNMLYPNLTAAHSGSGSLTNSQFGVAGNIAA